MLQRTTHGPGWEHLVQTFPPIPHPLKLSITPQPHDPAVAHAEQQVSYSAWYAGPVAKFMPTSIRARYLEQISYHGSVDGDRKPHGYGGSSGSC